MTDAPERIWAFYAPDVGEDNPQCSIVAGEHVMHGSQQYVRADLYAAQQAVIDDLVQELRDMANALEQTPPTHAPSLAKVSVELSELADRAAIARAKG